jgi:hypothetical protein
VGSNLDIPQNTNDKNVKCFSQYGKKLGDKCKVVFTGLLVLLKSAGNRMGEGGGEGDAALPPHTHTHSP